MFKVSECQRLNWSPRVACNYPMNPVTRAFWLAAALLLTLAAPLPAQVIEDVYHNAALFIAPTGQEVDPPIGVTDMNGYMDVYGEFHSRDPDYGRLSAELFFHNGGERLYVLNPGSCSVSHFQAALNRSMDLPVDLVAMPGAALCDDDPDEHFLLMFALIDHVSDSPNRFAVLDAPIDSDWQELIDYRQGFNSRRGALYAPWLEVDDPEELGKRQAVPPSGAVAGVITRTDLEGGLHSSPAGEDAALSFQLVPMLERDLSDYQSELNPENVNVLRTFDDSPPIHIWGVRSLIKDDIYPWIPPFRMVRFLDYSITESLNTWLGSPQRQRSLSGGDLEEAINDYLYSHFRAGAFQGTTVDEAYFSNCDVDGLEIKCLVGVAMIKPSEFVPFRVEMGIPDTIFHSRFDDKG